MKKKELFNPVHLKKSSIINVNDIFEIIFKGGMPKIYTEKKIMRDMFFESYKKSTNSNISYEERIAINSLGRSYIKEKELVKRYK